MITSKLRNKDSMLLYDFSSIVINSCGVSGGNGPSNSQILTNYAGSEIDGFIEGNSLGRQLWTVPATGYYNFTLTGGYGAYQSDTTPPGSPAIVTGSLYLQASEVLEIVIGQLGDSAYILDNTPAKNSSGGGGTFLVRSGNIPLLVAGGSAGGSYSSPMLCQNASLTEDGQNTGEGTVHFDFPSTNGEGGLTYVRYYMKPQVPILSNGLGWRQGNSWYAGGAGGGFISDGETPPNDEGGFSFLNGSFGGTSYETSDNYGYTPYILAGGFGGGGGGGYYGGGGGGYSGGHSGQDGGVLAGGWDYLPAFTNNCSGGGGSYSISTATNVTKTLAPGPDTYGGGHLALPVSGSIVIEFISGTYVKANEP